MKTAQYPAFVQNLPQADLPVEGIRGWLLNSENGQVLFLKTERTTAIPLHQHGDQWGIMIEGSMELTIADKTEIYHAGDSYFIPAGTVHGAVLHEGCRVLDYFADKGRYSIK
jgi:quercetin dioxygenase-like cupin family protein